MRLPRRRRRNDQPTAPHRLHRPDALAMLSRFHDDIVLILDAGDGRIITASPSWHRLVGPGRDDFLELVLPDDRSAVAAAIVNACPPEAEIAPRLIELVRADGSTATMSAKITDHVGRPPVEGVLIVLRDVTELTALDRELRDVRRLEQALLDSTSTMLAVVDARGTVLAANQAWRQRAAERNPVATPVGVSAVEPRPHYREESNGLRASLLGVLLGRANAGSLSVTREEQTWDVHIRGVDVGEARAVVSANDVTESLRLAQAVSNQGEQLSALFSSVPLGLAQLDADLDIVQCNTSFDELIGRPLQGVRFPTLVSDHAQQHVLRAADALFARGDGRFDAEVALVSADGTERTARLSMVPNNHAGSRRLTVVVEDVSTLRQMEHELERQHRQESVGDLAVGVAAEIATPAQIVADNLIHLRGEFARLAAAGSVDPTALGQLLTVVDESATGIGRIVEVSTALKRFALSHTDETVYGDINDSICATLRLLEHQVDHVAQVELDLEDLPLVRCDHPALGQVIFDLIRNAVHAIEDGPRRTGRIVVRTIAVDDTVEIAVSDDGVGMDDEVRVRAVERFFTTKDVGRGRGLGLAHARAVVEAAHGGHLILESTPGRGTTARVRLPVEGRERTRAAAPHSHSGAGT